MLSANSEALDLGACRAVELQTEPKAETEPPEIVHPQEPREQRPTKPTGKTEPPQTEPNFKT